MTAFEQLLPDGLMVDHYSRGRRTQSEAQARQSCQINRSRFVHGLRAVGVTAPPCFYGGGGPFFEPQAYFVVSGRHV